MRPGSDGDLASVLRWAARNGRRVAPQGRRHSVFGRGQAAGGVAVDMRGRCAVHSVQRDWVVMDAGATWRQVLAATLPQGLAPATLRTTWT